jgi:hypothetical protein
MFRMRTRRLISALVGTLLFLGALVESCRGVFGFYQEYYLFPKEKYGVLTPLRWQDIAFLVSFWLEVSVLFFLSYLLLKYSFREPAKRVYPTKSS